MIDKKLAIITYHRSYNYGAALQAYATVQYFKSLGLDSILIDYYPKNLKGFGTYRNSFYDVSNANRSLPIRCILTIIKTPGYKKLKKVFDSFIEKELPLTKPYYDLNELISDLPIADLYCTGSDQVWNNYFTHGFDGAFFLDFVPENKIKISLAASFGKEEFNNAEMLYLKKHLSNYSYISVREEAGMNIISELGYDSELMLDPTLLVNPDLWFQYANSGRNSEKYIFVYQLHGDSNAFEYAKKLSKITGLKLYRLVLMPYQKKKNCNNIVLPDIRQFVSYIKNAEYIITDSFHGSVFSIIFNRKLGIVKPKRFGNRIDTLTNEIGVKSFVIDSFDQWLNNEFDKIYPQINTRLIELRKNKDIQFRKQIKTLLK